MTQTKNFKGNNHVVRNEVIDAMLSQINRYKPLSDSELRELITMAHNGSEVARNKVINANLRIVWSIAASYGTIMAFEDMFQNGSIGLCKAVDTFDVSRGTMFSTWALEQIRKYINIGIDNDSRVVRMGVHEIRAKKSYNAASMDAPLASDEDGEKTLLDTFASDMKCDTFSEKEDMRVKINYLLGGLKEVERAIVCGLFGLTDDIETEYTLSKKFNLTEERVRQIKWEALAKMKEIA